MKGKYFQLFFLLSIMCSYVFAESVSAQTYVRYVKPADLSTDVVYADSVLTSIELPKGIAKLSNYPKFNMAALELAKVLQDPDKELLQVWVCGSTSPDGLWADNVRLSQARTDAAVSYIKSLIRIPDSKIHKESLNEDWDRLAELVAESDMPFKDEVLYIIRNKAWGERKTALQKLGGGTVWKILEKEYFPMLRCVRFAIYCRWEPTKPYLSVPDAPECELPVQECMLPQKDTIYIRDTVYYFKETVLVGKETPVETSHVEPQIQETYEQYRRKSLDREKKMHDTPWMMGFKTNLLADAIVVPTLGVEFQLGRHLSLDIQGWKTDYNVFTGQSSYTNVYGFSPEIRWWIGDRIMRKGSFIGLHGRCMWYNLVWKDGVFYQNGPDRWILTDQGRYRDPGNMTPAWSVGLTYGYSLGLGRKGHWGIEFLLGVGYGKYQQNLAVTDDRGVLVFLDEGGHQDKTCLGITRAGINLTYRFSLRKVNPDYYETH